MNQIELRDIQPRPAVSIRDKVARKEIIKTVRQLIPEVQAYLDAEGLTAAGPPFARLHNYGQVKRVNVDLEVGIPLGGKVDVEGEDQIMSSELPGCQAAVIRYSGPYDEIGEAYEALQEWVQGSEYEAAGAPWESFHSEIQAEDWEVEVVWPLA